jgi:hypothetical protein
MNPASAAEGSVQVHSVFLCVLCVSEFFSLTPEKLTPSTHSPPKRLNLKVPSSERPSCP